jgi:diamine N-acetyltransferase
MVFCHGLSDYFWDRDSGPRAIYVDPGFQGRGVGKALMDSAFAHPRARRGGFMLIDVWDENERALSFYLRYGFRQVGRCEAMVNGKPVGFDLVLAKKIG